MTRNDEVAAPQALDFPLPEEMQRAVFYRLRRLEGQVRGIQRMVEEGRDCREILDQIAAIKAAAHSLGVVMLEHYVLACLYQRPASLSPKEADAFVHEVVRQMAR